MKMPALFLLLKMPLLAFLSVAYSPVLKADWLASIPDEAHDCIIEPSVVVNVGSPVQGVVTHLLVDRGAQVSKGQAIAELDSGSQEAMLRLAELRVELQGDLIARKVDLALARRDTERFSSLYTKKMMPEKQRDEAVAREKMASGAYIQTLENQKLQLLELRRSRQVVRERTIRSPVDGVFVNQLVFPGEFVYDNPIMTVAELKTQCVEIVLPAKLLGTIHRGEKAKVFPELDHHTPFIASVDVVDPLLDAKSGTFGIRLLLPNADLAITSGQKCRVAFHG